MPWLSAWVASAGGGSPALVELYEGNAGSYVRLAAAQILFGNNTVFDDATDTMRTTIGSNIRIMAFGSPFGASGNLLEWWGPSSISIGAMTTANGHNGRMTSAPYVFDNVIGGGGGLAATASPDLALGSAPGGGLVTSNTVTINVTGPGAASAVVRWVKTEETGGTIDVYPSGKTAYFRGNVSPGGLTRALYLAVVSYGGLSVTVLVDVQLTDSN